ncbi:hypothetical protein TNCV_4183451 [Trichonephila clavipes]|nr:hypothetical protein TNCV_4183451 [Trichonephila clavipes]
MTCDAEGYGFQMLNDDEIVTSVPEESDPVDKETDEDEGNNYNKMTKNLSLIEFLNETLGLTMSNDRNYHKPIVSFLEYNEMIERTDNLSIVEINDDNDVNNENNVQT